MLVAFLFVSSNRKASAQSSEKTLIRSGSCIGGMAGGFSCSAVDLLSFVPKEAIGGGGGSVSDLWGWTDGVTGREYGLVGLSAGTAFVDVTNPALPDYLGILPAQTVQSAWRDIKVFADHAFVVSEATDHGVQIFDLRRLRAVVNKPATFSADTVYTGIGSAHNIVVNEESGFVYAVGSRGGDFSCGPGLHMIDVRDPKNPVPAGCFGHIGTGRAGLGYTHDAQCVIYRGPDSGYNGREICIGSNENFLSIADVTDKSDPQAVSSATYPNARYIHQGWLTDDQRYFLQDDELDELRSVVFRTTTQIWDLSDLDAPLHMGTYSGTTTASDHNLYVVNDWAYMANYRAGLQVVDFTDIRNPHQVAFFDTFPQDDLPGTNGAWSVYPFFKSGTVLVSAIEDGLFILKPPFNETVGTDNEQRDGAGLKVTVFPNPLRDEGLIKIEGESLVDVQILVFDLLGREVLRLQTVPLRETGSRTVSIDTRSLSAGPYVLQARAGSALESRLVTVVR